MYQRNAPDADTQFDPSVYQPAVKQTMMPISNCYTGNYAAYTLSEPSGPGENAVQTPEILTNPIYVPAYLKNNIGKMVRLEMLIGSSIVSRMGRLTDVGTNFIVLKVNDNETLLCDIFIVKLVTLINSTDNLMLSV